MGRVAATVDELNAGAPPFNGEQAVIVLPSGYREPLMWNGTHWVGRARPTMREVDNVGMSAQGSPVLWKYPADHIEQPDPTVNGTAFGFSILKVVNGDEYFAAGLRLQEHLAAALKVIDAAAGVSQLALAWYDLKDGDDFLSPPSYNHGVRLTHPRQDDLQNYHWASTGWQDSPAASPPPDSHLYPELYINGPALNFRNLHAQHRWVAGPLGGEGLERPSTYPVSPNVLSWHVAGDVAAADGAGVAEWPDYSGRGRHLQQASATKRPTLHRAGGPNNAAYVSFDGVNDWLKTALLEAAQPWAIFLVMRQRAAGGAVQVWAAHDGTAGAPLFYRGDNAGQVNLWLGGSDIVYDRGDWPTPWVIMAAKADGATSSIWENGTKRVEGDAGAIHLHGLALGARGDETLPAAIDVAEVVVTYADLDDAGMDAQFDQLRLRYGVY